MLQSQWKSEADFDDAAKALHDAGHIVKDDDGRLTLKVQGMRPKADVDTFRDQNQALTAQMEEIKESMVGGLTPKDAETQQRLIEELQARLDAGEDDDRVKELMTKRLKPLKIGTREVNVLRTDFPHLKHHFEATVDTTAASKEANDRLLIELTKERIVNGAHAAMAAIGGIKEKAEADVVRYIVSSFRMGEDLQPYMPDPSAPPASNGEQPPALLDEEGNTLSILGKLKAMQTSGETAWWHEPSGVTRKTIPSHPSKDGQAHGVDSISAGLKRRQARQAR